VDRGYAACLLCYAQAEISSHENDKEIDWKSFCVLYCGSPSKLTRHLERNHGDVIANQMQEKSDKSLREYQTITKFLIYGNQFEEAALEWAVKSYEPLATFNDPLFRNMISAISTKKEFIISSERMVEKSRNELQPPGLC
jgi:hypothetical protein